MVALQALKLMEHLTSLIQVVPADEHKPVGQTVLVAIVDYVASEDQSGTVSAMSLVMEPWERLAEQMPVPKSVVQKMKVPRWKA